MPGRNAGVKRAGAFRIATQEEMLRLRQPVCQGRRERNVWRSAGGESHVGHTLPMLLEGWSFLLRFPTLSRQA